MKTDNDTQLTVKPAKDASLSQWLDYLLSIHPTEIDMGLTRVTAVAERLSLLSLADSKVITVAGTNGKGTTCAMLEAVFLQAGKTVGVYSSPHLVNFNERVRLNHIDVTDAQIIEAFSVIEHARAEISLSFFEFATLTGLYIFKLAKPEIILLEVGLGGRLDATNIIDADVSVITSIDIDHQEYLGDTRELVGREKAGVFRTECLAVIGEPDCPNSITEYAQAVNAYAYSVNKDFSYVIANDTSTDNTSTDNTSTDNTSTDNTSTDNMSADNRSTWHYSSANRSIEAIPLPRLPLANAATAIAVIEQAFPQLSDNDIKQGIANASLSGRFEQVLEQPKVWVDVAHNPHAAKYLATQLQGFKPARIIALCGMLKDKDAAAVLKELEDSIDEWNFVSLPVERGNDAKTLAKELNTSLSASQFDSMDLAWRSIKSNINADDVVIVFGSFYTVAAFSELLKKG
ncbi:bifunctional folylpolyglutamate synthase/dihydrofolate synthase [Shewanella sp. 10N.286.52.C2]|uniref:bifunctional tetrahydrofolate synthase/dihydrofolate synthase n=1 Tax=Shewanella sp. 10N.286.52.C2 TaxID=1880838 RepID=UPI000C83B9E2|nr:bifunctional tetrahydrofolate synthase/dihydrofolate synthase [Shewanella sp. 10N.286.52.C2]PMG28048.1 bifunctional folylpolyglutamate synthase/dihydrofolate synthase [Shewanella sp. 10N.286.52.C2]